MNASLSSTPGIRGCRAAQRVYGLPCVAQAGKSPEEKAAKKQRRKQFLQRRREAVAWKQQTQGRSHWYELHTEGVWEEHRQPPPSSRSRGRPTSASASGYHPTAADLAAVALRTMPPPPADWTAPAPGPFATDLNSLVLGGPQHQQQQQQQQERQGHRQRVSLPSQPWKNRKKLSLWKQQQREEQLGFEDLGA